MANFDFQLPDGRVIRVEGAPSEEAARSFMDTQWGRLRRETPIEGFGESFGQAFRGQFGSVPGALQAGAAAAGASDTAAFFGRGREFVAPGDQNPRTRAPELGDIVRNPVDALSAFAGQAAGAVIGGAGAVAVPTIAGAAIGAVGGPGGAGAGALTGARIGVLGSSVLGSVDELYQGLVAEGIEPQRAGRLAITYGSAIGAAEGAALLPVLKRITGGQLTDSAIDRLAGRIVGGRAGGIRQTAALGTAGEMLGETARQGVIAGETGELDLAERASRVGEAGIVGGIAGGGIGGVTRAIGRAGPAPGATQPSAEQEAAALQTLRESTLPGEALPEGTAAPTPPPAAEGAPPRPAPLTLPDRPEPLTDVEEARAFLAANPAVAPTVMPTQAAGILGAANNARIEAWNETVATTRATAIKDFFPADPQTTAISPVEAINNIAAAANRGDLGLRSFTPNEVARAALTSRDIDPGRVTKTELQEVTKQLDALAATGAIRQNTVEATTKKGKKVIKREPSYSINYGTAAQPTPAPAPAPQAAAAPAPVPPAAQGTPVPQAAPAPPAPQIALDPLRNNRPANLRDTDGWKLHIGTDGMSPQQIQRLIQEFRNTGARGKLGRSGGQIGKDVTIYAGSRADAERIAQQLSPFTSGRIYGDTAVDDVELAPGVGARFDVAGDRDFHQYGRGGIPILRDLIEIGKPFSDEAIQRSEATLAQRYGEFFTGRPAQPAARTTVEVGGVQRETTPETLQQTVDEMRAGPRPAPAAAAAAPPPPPPAGVAKAPLPEDAKKQIKQQTDEPIIGSVMNFFASPVMTLTKLSTAFAPVRTAFMKFSAVESFYKDRAAAAHQPLHNLNNASKQKVILGLDNARRTKQEVNEADYTAEEMGAIRSFRAHMKFIYDAAIDGVARKYFDPALATDPAQRARLQAFQDRFTGQFLADIPDAALDAASPEGAKLVRKYKAQRDPLFFPQRTEGTHFVAAYEKGKKEPVALYGYNPLNGRQRARGFEDPEAVAIRKLREEFPNTDTHRVMTAGVRFENDERARDLKRDGDFINKYLERLRDVSGKEGKRIIDQMGAEIDKATMDSLFKPYKGILRAVTPENAVEYASNYLPAYYLTAGRLNTRLLTKEDFNQAFKPLRPENRELFQGVLDYTTSPSEAYGAARTFVFMSYLGGALDTAAVSALQIPTAVAPRFGRDGGVARGTEYLTKALNESLFDPAILNVLKADQAYAKTLASKPGRRDEVEALRRAIQRGVLRPSSAFQMQGSVSAADLRAAGITDKGAVKFANGINTVVDLAGRPLAAVEEFGRTATFLAAYRMARDNPDVITQANRYDNMQYKTAEDYAQGVVFDTWYAGSKMDDPGFIRDFPIANVATQFMRPVFKFTETVIRDATKTLKAMATTDLTMARMGAISLFGSLGPLVLLGGLWALPFADLSRELLERMLKTFFDSPIDFRLELDRAMGGGFIGEAANFGLPSASNIANLSRRIAVDPLPSDTLFDFSTLALIGPAGDLLTRIPKTYEHWKRGEYWEAAASFPLTPRVIGNAIKGTQLAVDQEQFTQAGTRFITPELLERVDQRSYVPASARQALGFPAPELANERELWRRAQVIDKATDSTNKSITMELSRIFLRALEAQQRGDMAENARQVEALQRRIQEIYAEQQEKPPHLRGNINMNAVRDRARQDLLGRSSPEVLIEETRRQARPALPPIIEEMRWRDRQ